MNKWLTIAVVGCGLTAFGYMVHLGQRAKTLRMSQAPISVAAVRGGDGLRAPDVSSAGNAAVDYTKALQDDVELAKKRTESFNAATKARADEVRRTAESGGTE